MTLKEIYNEAIKEDVDNMDIVFEVIVGESVVELKAYDAFCKSGSFHLKVLLA